MCEDTFWNRLPTKNITKEENEILQQIEKRIEIDNLNNHYLYSNVNIDITLKKKKISIRPFLYDIFCSHDSMTQNEDDLYTFTTCSEKKCVNPDHLIKTTHFLASRLKMIGWDHANKSKE